MIRPFRITPTVYVFLAPVKGQHASFVHCTACRSEQRVRNAEAAREATAWLVAHEPTCKPVKPYTLR